MRRSTRITGGVVTLMSVILARIVGADTAYAHEKWFIHAENYPRRIWPSDSPTWTGRRIRRLCSASARLTACRIHQVA